MFNKLTLILFFTVITYIANAQKGLSGPVVKYGSITAEEFAAGVKGPDSAAAAIKIFDIGKGSFRYSHVSEQYAYVFERHVRYKVVNKNAYDLANLEIVLYDDQAGGEEKLESITGTTYNLNGKEIIVSKMDNAAKFSSRLDKRHFIKTFTLPNLKEGSIIEYHYTTKSDFIYRLDDWKFQGSYPCLYSSFTLTAPQFFAYRTLKGGYLPINQSKPVQVADPVAGIATKVQFQLNNIPSIKDENYITTLEDYVSKVGFELHSIQYPNQSRKEFSSTWAKLIAQLKSHEKFGGYLKHNNYDNRLLNDILKGATDNEIKINLIFNYVKNQVKWDGKYSDFTEASNQRTVLEKRSGNSAEINLLLLSLLKDAGVDASPVWISTRNNGEHPGYPVATKFNNVLVLAENGAKKHMLDATGKNNADGLVSYQNLSHKGLKIDLAGDTADWIYTEFTNLSKSTNSYILKLDTSNILTGRLFINTDNYAAVNRRNKYQSATSQKDFIENEESGKTGLEISDYQVNNMEQAGEVLSETMTVRLEDQVEVAGNLIYFMPLMFERVKENPFKLEDRNFPVDFAYPTESNYLMTIEYPKNYKLEKLPQSARYRLENNAGSFTILYSSDENGIMVNSKINISKAVFSPAEYYDLKELYKNIVQKQAERIVFRKISD